MALEIDRVTSYIRQMLPHAVSPADIAAHFGYSRFYLSHRFKQEMGISLRDYIAALKIEHSLSALIEQQSIIDSQLEAGHASAGTYSHVFRQHTGISPRVYRQEALTLSKLFDQQLSDPLTHAVPYYTFVPENHPQAHPLILNINNRHARSVVFVGLYEKPIPRGAPVFGVALFRGEHITINHIPNGEYYLLACEITPSMNVLHYFRLDHCLRALNPQPVAFPLSSPQEYTLTLRPFLPSDPPITVNMPKLLFDVLLKRAIHNK